MQQLKHNKMNNFDLRKYLTEGSLLNEEDEFVEVNADEIKMHLDQYRNGNIGGDELANVIEEIVGGGVIRNQPNILLDPDTFPLDVEESCGSGHAVKQKKIMGETLDEKAWDKLDRLRDAIDDDDYIITSMIKAMSASDVNLYLDAMIRDHIDIVSDDYYF